MKNTLRMIQLTALGILIPSLSQAVAVPPELLQNEGPMGHGFIYGVILAVFTFGVVLGVWIKRRMH